MTTLEHLKDFFLMVWKLNQSNQNNTIKFNLKNHLEINVGDVLYLDSYSKFEITEIKEIRPSSLSGLNYVTAVAKWSKKQKK